MRDEERIELAVIGGGPAGLAAAAAAARAGVKDIVIFDRQENPGGILNQCIHNGFGLSYFKEELTGPEYAQRFLDRVKEYPQIEIKSSTMVIELTPDRRLQTVSSLEGLRRYAAGAVILAMGCRERPRGAINIPGARPSGIYTAGTVQRLMNIEGYLPGEKAVILGSGDIGLIIARRLAWEGVEVKAVLEIMPYSSGLKRNVVQCLEDNDIPLYLNHTVVEVIGEERIEKVIAAPVDAEMKPDINKAFKLDCDLLVLSVGLIPENELSLMAGIELDSATGGPLVDSSYMTSVEGIFSCGNVTHVNDLVDNVSEESEVAGRVAAAFINHNPAGGRLLTVEKGRNIGNVVPQKLYQDRPAVLYIRSLFPEDEVRLTVGNKTLKRRYVRPGETIRFNFKPEMAAADAGTLKVNIQQGGK